MLPVGFLTQEVERCTGIAGVTGATPVQAFIFLEFLIAVAKIASTTVIMFVTFKICFLHLWYFFFSKSMVLTFEYVDTKYSVRLLCGHLNKNPVQ